MQIADYLSLAARRVFPGPSRRVSDSFLLCTCPGSIRAPSSLLSGCSIADAACPPRGCTAQTGPRPEAGTDALQTPISPGDCVLQLPTSSC